jgi:DNA-binding MarR family transcriptional regulator
MTRNFRDIADMDRVIHEPARLMLVTLLYAVDGADFLYLLREGGLTKGNLSTHLARLEQAGYIQVEKSFRGKIPQTLIRLTPSGRAAFQAYRLQLKRIVETTSK